MQSSLYPHLACQIVHPMVCSLEVGTTAAAAPEAAAAPSGGAAAPEAAAAPSGGEAEPEAEAAPSGEASNAMEEEHVCHNSLTPFLYQRMCIKTPTSDIACSPQDSAGADGTRPPQAGGTEPPPEELIMSIAAFLYPDLD